MPMPLYPKSRKILVALQHAFPEPLPAETLALVLYPDRHKPAHLLKTVRIHVSRARIALHESGSPVTVVPVSRADGSLAYSLGRAG
jgi:hypothetical protein